MRTRLLALCLLTAFGCSSDSPAAPTPSADVTIVNGASTKGASAFSPNPFTISLASQTTVKWRNDDDITHTIVADAGGFTSGNIPKNGTFSTMFITPGTYDYHCSIHAGMVGSIVVNP